MLYPTRTEKFAQATLPVLLPLCRCLIELQCGSVWDRAAQGCFAKTFIGFFSKWFVLKCSRESNLHLCQTSASQEKKWQELPQLLREKSTAECLPPLPPRLSVLIIGNILKYLEQSRDTQGPGSWAAAEPCPAPSALAPNIPMPLLWHTHPCHSLCCWPPVQPPPWVHFSLSPGIPLPWFSLCILFLPAALQTLQCFYSPITILQETGTWKQF